MQQIKKHNEDKVKLGKKINVNTNSKFKFQQHFKD